MTDVERLKRSSRGLRGELATDVPAGDGAVARETAELLKFHGMYQQDDRDRRRHLRRAGAEPAWSFMVRSSVPGGLLEAEQYLAHDELARRFEVDGLRITSRQGLQLHGVLRGRLQEHVRTLHEFDVATWGACGDVVRNVASGYVEDRNIAIAIHRFVRDLDRAFTADRSAYSDVWLDGVRVERQEDVSENIYGADYLPRKFKIGVAVPPWNDVDVMTHDLGFIADVRDGQVAGFDVVVGGGMGMTFGRTETWPALATPIAWIPTSEAVSFARAVVVVHRDFGRRDDRKQARLKYVLARLGIDGFKDAVRLRLGRTFDAPRGIALGEIRDPLGWTPSVPGYGHLGVWVDGGRIRGGLRQAIRRILEEFGVGVRLTPNHNLQLLDVPDDRRREVEAVLRAFDVPDPGSLSRARRDGIACVALPTCGKALAESERVFGGLMRRLESRLVESGLEEEPLLLRMVGCPNGCARPYNADVAIVGRGLDRYALYVGGSHRGDRLARLELDGLSLDRIESEIARLLEEFASRRLPEESFSDYRLRTRGDVSSGPRDFHLPQDLRESGTARRSEDVRVTSGGDQRP